MSAFYKEDRWLYLKSLLLDKVSYSKAIHDELKKNHFKQVLDCGTGTGEFVKVLCDFLSFDSLTGLDINPGFIEKASEAFTDCPKDVKFHVHNLYDETANKKFNDFDLITGQGLLEYSDMDKMLPALIGFCKPGGYLYFPHCYISPTMFMPVYDNAVDQAIIANFDSFAIENQEYGGHIGGDSKCGAKLFHLFKDYGLEVLQFASTNWLLCPMGSDGYMEEERELLEMLVSFFYQANKDPRIPLNRRLHPKVLEEWNVARLNEIQENQLVFICPQSSILARKPE